MRTPAMLALALATLALFSVTKAADPVVIEGEGEACAIVVGYENLQCYTETTRDPEPVTVGSLSQISLTIEWDPVSEDARELRMEIDGNDDCYYDHWGSNMPDCYTKEIQGESPLTLTLYGEGASNTTVSAIVIPPRACPSMDLRSPDQWCSDDPIRIYRHQPFHYRWTIIEE